MCGIPTLAVHRPSISSFEIVRREYKNKNRGKIYLPQTQKSGGGKVENSSFPFFSHFAPVLAGKLKLSNYW